MSKLDNPFVLAIIAALAAPIGVFVGWLLNRKKNVADIYSVIGASSQTAVETMQATMNTLHEELKITQKKVDLLVQENAGLKQAMDHLRDQNDLLIAENAELRQQIENLSSFMASTREVSDESREAQPDLSTASDVY